MEGIDGKYLEAKLEFFSSRFVNNVNWNKKGLSNKFRTKI